MQTKRERKETTGKKGEENTHWTLCVNCLFFSFPLTGTAKNVLSTLCICVWSPGARAWLKVVAMNGIFSTRLCGAPDDEESDDGASRGIEIGKLGLAMSMASDGGRKSRSGVSPGTRSATTFWTWFAFCGLLLVNKE